MKWIIALVCSVVFTLPVYAEEANSDLSPVGKWRTIDDATGKAKGLVQLEIVGIAWRDVFLTVIRPPMAMLIRSAPSATASGRIRRSSE